MDRRRFIQVAAATAAWPALPMPLSLPTTEEKPFEISLAQWSLHRTIQAGKLDNLDFAATARSRFKIKAVEYVNQFFKSKAQDEKYLADMKKRAEDVGVRSLLIMVDGEGRLGDADTKKRAQAIDRHKPWVLAARSLGCHAIRVNAYSSGSFIEQQERAADGLRQLSLFAAEHGLNVIVENHGGLSSNGLWLAGVMKRVQLVNCGTLPDFGNFQIKQGEVYDRYKGVTEMMPYAKAVSAKSHDFDKAGNELHTDYSKMLGIVHQAGYRGYVGIEYEGGKLSEDAGIRATLALLKRVRNEITKTR